jgi:hypothetical protein
MVLKAEPAGWRSWSDFAPLYVMVNLPLILLAAGLMAYLPTDEPASVASVKSETAFLLYLSGAILSTLLSFPWQWRFLHRCIACSGKSGRFNVPLFTFGYYWRNLLVSIVTAAITAAPLVYLVFFLVGFPLMMMLVPLHLLSGLMIGLLVANAMPNH